MSDPTEHSNEREHTSEQRKRTRELQLKKPLTDEQKQAKRIKNQRYYQKTKHLKKYTKANRSEDQIKKHRLRNTHANMSEKQIELHRKRNIHANMTPRQIDKHRIRVRDPKSFDKRGNQCKILTNFCY